MIGPKWSQLFFCFFEMIYILSHGNNSQSVLFSNKLAYAQIKNEKLKLRSLKYSDTTTIDFVEGESQSLIYKTIFQSHMHSGNIFQNNYKDNQPSYCSCIKHGESQNYVQFGESLNFGPLSTNLSLNHYCLINAIQMSPWDKSNEMT